MKKTNETNEKILISVAEAAKISGLGVNRLRKIAQEPNCPFSFRNGSNILIKRNEFIEYISVHSGWEVI